MIRIAVEIKSGAIILRGVSFITAENSRVTITLTSSWIKSSKCTRLQKKPSWNAVIIDQNVYA